MNKARPVITCGDEVRIELLPHSYIGVIHEVKKLSDVPYKEALLDASGRKILRPETLGEIGDIYVQIRVTGEVK